MTILTYFIVISFVIVIGTALYVVFKNHDDGEL